MSGPTSLRRWGGVATCVSEVRGTMVVARGRSLDREDMMKRNSSLQFWIAEPGRGEILRRDLPPRQDHEVLVRALFSGISRGTEALVFGGHVPRSQYTDMRAPFQEGSFPAPVKYGYSNVGRVLEGAGAAGSELVGQTVFCLYPHQDMYQVRASAVVPLAPDLPPERAVLAANMETAVNAVWDGDPSAGDRIIVIGSGVVGLLISWLCGQIPGVEVTAVDLNPERAAQAAALGISFSTEAPRDGRADLVFHASGSPAGLRAALEAAGAESVVVEVSWYGTESVCLRLGEGFHSRRITIRSSQVGGLPPAKRSRWTPARRLELALDLLSDPSLDVLISGESAFKDLPEVMAQLSEGSNDALCHRIRYT